MGLIEDIRLYTLAHKLYAETKREALIMVGTKPGWKTSEFWLTVITNLIGILGMEKGSVPAQYQPYVIAALTVLNAVYTVARTFIKQTDSATITTATAPETVTTTTTKP